DQKTLFVTTNKNEYLSARNIQNISIVMPDQLTAHSIISNNSILWTKDAIDSFTNSQTKYVPASEADKKRDEENIKNTRVQKKSAVKKPVKSTPEVKKPASSKPAAKSSTIKPAVKKPATSTSLTKKPVATKKPAKPSTKKSAKPVAKKSTKPVTKAKTTSSKTKTTTKTTPKKDNKK
ncbi:MAG: 50S ribosomal protein L4, partial [Clostridiales bacterium]|nr:50S ribosomal protein L4 [Clostridiales bacterium]